MDPNRIPGGNAVAILLLSAAAAFSVEPWTYPPYTAAQDLPYPSEFRGGIVYAKGRTQTGDIDLLMDGYYPKGLDGAKKAAAIFIHPGSFLNGDRTRMVPHCLNMARRGVVGFSIEYRKQGDNPSVELPPLWVNADPSELPKGPFTDLFKRSVNAAYIDAKAAIRYVHAHAAELGIDTANIFVAGGSAGALTALAAGVTPRDLYVSDSLGKRIRPQNNPEASMSVRGIVAWSGGLFLDLPQLDPLDPPILMYHGDKDSLVPYEEAVAIKERCDSIGLDCELHTVPNGDHLPTDGAPTGTFEETTTSFVMRHLAGSVQAVGQKTARWDDGCGKWRVASGRIEGVDLPPDVDRIELAHPNGKIIRSSSPSSAGKWSAHVDRGAWMVVVRRRDGTHRALRFAVME